MEDKVSLVLGSIGLNKNEIKIYLDLIQHGKSSALDISKRTKIHRSNTYDAIRKLTERGFIEEILEEKKRFFHSVQPNKLRDYIRQQENEICSIIPCLSNMANIDEPVEKVSILRGVFAVRESLRDLLKLNKPIMVYGVSHESVESLGYGYIKEFHSERIKGKILMRNIYSQDAAIRAKQFKKMKFDEARVFPEKFHS
jgi:sugar-specific transcriptional regulator TrmB